MNAKKTIFSSILLAFISCFASLSAQVHEVGIIGGIANYQGELASFMNVESPGPLGGIFYRANVSRSFSIRGNLGFAQISDDDADSDENFALQRNHSFRTIIIELSAQAEYNFLDFRGGKRGESQNWSPYVFAGLGVYKTEPLDNEQPTYSTTGVSIPLGVGLKAVLSGNFNIGFEFGARFTFDDRLDDLGLDVNSTVQTNLNPKFFSGNPDDNDMYFFSGITLSYVVPNLGKDCPISF